MVPKRQVLVKPLEIGISLPKSCEVPSIFVICKLKVGNTEGTTVGTYCTVPSTCTVDKDTSSNACPSYIAIFQRGVAGGADGER